MSSLKEVKRRIISVENTRKITLARKMISSAKLHRYQGFAENAVKYREILYSILKNVAASYNGEKDNNAGNGKVVIVVMSSNSGMCGPFNVNIIRELYKKIQELGRDNVILFPLGKKIREELTREGYGISGNYDDYMAEKPSIEKTDILASVIMDLYMSGKVERVELLYYHFKNIAIQEIKQELYLPFDFTQSGDQVYDDYILEPLAEELYELLLSKALKFKLYSALLDNHVSEHAARTMAMQLASENAKNIITELRMAYNKLRQQNITTELLDIVGGSFT